MVIEMIDKKHVPPKNEIAQLIEKVDYRKIRLEGNEIRLEPDMMLDIGAVGKGYAGDVVTGLMKEKGITSALLDLGGNIQTIGKKQDGNNWRLGLKDPENDGNLGVLSISDCAVVTSGNYGRYFTGEDGKIYGHIINPETGYPAESGLLSVTVIVQVGLYEFNASFVRNRPPVMITLRILWNHMRLIANKSLPQLYGIAFITSFFCHMAELVEKGHIKPFCRFHEPGCIHLRKNRVCELI